MTTIHQVLSRTTLLWLISLVLLTLSPFAAAAASDTDPLEPLNRKIFAFNSATDQHLLRPIAVTYKRATPTQLQTGLSNALGNLRDVNYAANSLLQGRIKDGLANTGRIVINSTLGLLGLFDVATSLGLQSRSADFGETLATWGAPAGPYLVLPIIGPSTVRDSVGFTVDAAALAVPAHLNSTTTKNSIWGSAVVDTRAELLTIDGLMTGDRYIFLRDAYLQRRNAILGNSDDVDAFASGSDFDWGDSDF